MQHGLNRRNFLRTTGAAGIGIGWAGLGANFLSAAEASSRLPYAKKLGWRLACAAYTFVGSTFDTVLGLVADLGFDSLEGLHDMRLSADKPDVRFGYMSIADCRDVKKQLEDRGITLIGCYHDLPSADKFRKVFDWAKEMDVQYIAAEPPFDAYETLDKLCQEYRIKVAIHNHATPTPDVLAEHLRGRKPVDGACCDTGHWVRRGLNPVEMMKILRGRILNFHLKDMSAFGVPKAGCVPFGTGKGNVEGILREARRQRFHGNFTIEYEPSPRKELVAECIVAFERMAKNLAGT